MTSYSHLFVHVRDLEKTREFYAGLLGLTVLMEHPGYLRLGGGEGFHIGFEERDEAETGATGVEIVIRVDDVDTAYHRLRAAGVVFQTAPRGPGVGRTARLAERPRRLSALAVQRRDGRLTRARDGVTWVSPRAQRGSRFVAGGMLPLPWQGFLEAHPDLRRLGSSH